MLPNIFEELHLELHQPTHDLKYSCKYCDFVLLGIRKTSHNKFLAKANFYYEEVKLLDEHGV